ncbi:MAG: hypothetical protein HQ518_26330 [Rhodopirellula sp.]|nr:hypothetical protein [Rhodopirellula sp.]
MFTLPDIHPLLNLETVRCELKHCCGVSEEAMVHTLYPLIKQLSGPERQLLEEDTRQVRINLRWLRQRIHTFGIHDSASRDDWNSLIAQVSGEMQFLQEQAARIHESIFELATGHRESPGDDSEGDAEVSEEDSRCCC